MVAMKRVKSFTAIIDDCKSCPKFKSKDMRYNCKLMRRKLSWYWKEEIGMIFEIPEWCPLQDYRENKK